MIYRIPCNGCPRVYVGQTGRTLAQRLKEHKRALVSGHLAQSAVAEHAAQESHDIDWEGATDGCSAAISPEMPAGIVAHPI